MRLAFPCAGEYERIFVLCLTAASGIQGQEFCCIIMLPFYGNLCASNDQEVITGIGLSDCSLLFSIGTSHSNSHPSHSLLDSTLLSTLRHCRVTWWGSAAAALHHHCRRRRRRDFAATCVSRGHLLPPTTSSAAVACPRHRCRGRGRRRRKPIPAAD